MLFGEEDVLLFKIYIQTITEKPAPLDGQTIIVREGRHVWCSDWEIIELCKCLFYGIDVYLGDPPPRRLKNNPLWSQDAIIDQAEALKMKYVTATTIIEALKERRMKYVI